MSSPEPAVEDAAAITADWLTSALRSGGLTTTGSITAFEATTIGTGQVGSNVRFELEWADGDGREPASIVGKFPSEDEESRAAAAATETYVREVGFYRDLSGRVHMPIPTLFYVAGDEASNRFVLLLEDIAPAAQGDQLIGCSADEATLAIDAATGLHGPFWADETLTDLDWLNPRSPERLVEMATIFGAIFDGFAERYEHRLAPDVIDLGRWFVDHVMAFFNAPEAPRTLVHGDYRLDNMLFGTGEPSTSTGVPAPQLTVVDWQTATLGSGAADVAYFLGAGMAPDARADVEHEMVSAYHARLVADHGVDVGFDTIWHDYRVGSLSGYFMAVFASMIVGRTERGDEMFAVMAERHAAQAEHLDIRTLLA